MIMGSVEGDDASTVGSPVSAACLRELSPVPSNVGAVAKLRTVRRTTTDATDPADMSALVNQLTVKFILTTVGADAYQRGRAYANEGRVTDLAVNERQGTLFASVHGKRRTPYKTLVSVASDLLGEISSAHGNCTCPVGHDCKHAAAVMIAAGPVGGGNATAAGNALAGDSALAGGNGTAQVPASPWERPLAELIEPRGAAESPERDPLALQFEVVPSAEQKAGPRVYGSARRAAGSIPGPAGRVRIRPLVLGKSGRWVKTGASWRELQYAYGLSSHVQAHRDVLRQLLIAHQSRPYGSYSHNEQGLYLDQFDGAVWLLLARVAEAGVTFVPAQRELGGVRIAADPATIALDASHGSDGATLEPVVTVDGRTVRADAAELVGNPPHGAFLAVEDPAGRGPELVLARLEEAPSDPVLRLLRAKQAITIPEPDLDRFLNSYYPRLRQSISVVSTDESVELPEIVPPRLALTATYEPDNRLRLDWALAYDTADGPARCPLAGDSDSAVTGQRAPRDEVAERRLVAGLELPDDRLPQLRTATAGTYGLAPTVQLAGIDAVYATEELLPDLADLEDVDVEIVGTPPDYRHSDAAPLVQVSATDSGDGGETDWFDLGITVSVDGEEIPFHPLFVALATGDPYLILDSGTYFSLERPEFEELRRLIEEARSLQDRDSPEGQLRISVYQAGLWEELTHLGVVEAQSERWARTVKGLLDVDAVDPAPAPSGLAAELRGYQLEGYRWLAFLHEYGLGGILADDMGLGKTVQALAMVCRAHEQGTGELNGPFLVVAPTSVVHNWAAEAARFAPDLTVATVSRTESKRETPLAELAAGADLVITSYTLFRLDYDSYEALPWSGLLLDEAQYVKNYQAKSYQCVRRLPAPFKMAMTGTPLENNLMDLWSLLSVVAPGLFPNPERFAEFYRTPIEKSGDQERLAALRRRIRPLMRRRTKDEVVAELPPKQEQVLEVELNPRHRKIYQTHLQRERQKVLGLVDDMDKNRFAILKSLTLLRQLSLDASLVDEKYAKVRSSKTDAFCEQLRSVVGEGHRALVFSQFTGFLKTVRGRLDAEEIPYCYLDGRTRNRAKQIDGFKNGDAPVFLISLKAGGFGLNLTEADYCFVLDPWWNPAVETQAVDRTHRIGQDKTVMVYRLVAQGTIEEKVMELKARKQDLFTRVMDDGGLMSAPLSAADIRGLFEG